MMLSDRRVQVSDSQKGRKRGPLFAALAVSLALLPITVLGQVEPEEPSPPPESVDSIPVEPLREEAPVLPEAAAGAGGATQLDSIEVTASKRVKTLRDLPGSVGAIRGADLEAMQAQGLQDYLKLVPGVSFADRGNDTSVPIIRGIASEIGFGFTAQSTGIFLDDMPFADLLGPQSLPDLNPFDLERVEVLKGPQGTLFGSGALAGAVRYITQKPKHSVWESKASHTMLTTRGGGGASHSTAAAFNIPLFGNDAALRVVGLSRRDAGLYDMSATDDTGEFLRNEPDADRLRQTSWRALGSWNAADDLKVSALYFAQRSHADDESTAGQADRPAMDFVPFANPTDYEFQGGNLTATYDLGWASLLSSSNQLTKYTRTLNHQEWLLGLEHQNQNEFYNQLIGEVDGFTQELRLTSPDDGSAWEWVGGISYLRYKGSIFQYSPLPGPRSPPPDRPEDVSALERAAAFLFATIDTVGTEQAVFGEVTRSIGEHWEATLGARLYETRLVADTVLAGAQITALTLEPESRNHFEPESSGFNPKFSVRYEHSRNLQWYALAAKGFQFGGVQLNPPVTLFVQSAEQAGFSFGPYESSQLWNYETGLRTEWLDRRLRFDVGLFYLDWKDLQLTVTVPVSPTELTFAVIANVGRAHSQGVEAALEIIPFPGAKWISSAAWIEAETDVEFDRDNSQGPVPAGTRLPGTPRFAWSNVLSYERALPYFDSWTFAPVLTHSHVGSSPDAIRPTGTIGGYDSFDARLTFSRSGSRFLPEFSVGVTNLTDVHVPTFHTQATQQTSGEDFDFYHFLQPRTVILNLSMKY
jgi:iron complex outermembrane recepter protein